MHDEAPAEATVPPRHGVFVLEPSQLNPACVQARARTCAGESQGRRRAMQRSVEGAAGQIMIFNFTLEIGFIFVCLI